MSNIYHVDDLVTVTAQFKVGGDLEDPTTVLLRFGETFPLTTWVYGGVGTIVRDAKGLYHADLNVNRPGLWVYEWKGTGAAQASQSDAFSVSQGT